MLKTVLRVLMVSGVVAWGQAKDATPPDAGKPDRAAAYYYYSIAHFYAEKAAAAGGNKEYVDKMIENFKAALKADPSIPVTDKELSGGYMRVVPLHLPQASPSNPK